MSTISKRLPAILFPGQGNQHRAMIQDYLDRFPNIVRPILEEVDESLKQNFSKLLTKNTDADSSLPDINLTSNAQPAILTTSYTILKILSSHLSTSSAKSENEILASKFSFALGHSLGEYTAATATGVLNLADSVSLVHNRGKYMEQSREKFLVDFGPDIELGMYAVRFSNISSAEITKIFDSKIKPQLESVRSNPLFKYIELGNINSSSQIVFSGPKIATNQALSLIQTEMGIKRPFRSVPLNVSAPFHSPVMMMAQENMENFVKDFESKSKINWPPKIPIVSNKTARPFESKPLLIRSLSHSCTDRVNWYDSLRYIVNSENIQKVFSIGPGNIGDLTKRDFEHQVLTSCVNAETIDQVLEILEKN